MGRLATFVEKDRLKKELANCLSVDPEVRRIVVFGSFLTEDKPGDMDVAVFQDSEESYLNLAMKYRRQTRSVASSIPLDIIPLRFPVGKSVFIEQIQAGEVIYEA